MKIFYIILFIISFRFISCNDKIVHNTDNGKKIIAVKESLSLKSDTLIGAYIKNKYSDRFLKINKLKETFNEKKYYTFFYLFPNSFDEYLNLYILDEKDCLRPRSGAKNHVYFFFETYEYNKDKFIPKMFNLTKNGYRVNYDTDFLSEEIAFFVLYHPNEIVDYLITQPNEDVARFWSFVFDYPKPNKDKFETMYSLIEPLNSEQAEILRNVFEEKRKRFNPHCRLLIANSLIINHYII